MNVQIGGAPTSAAAVANEFLELARREPGVPAVTQMKLQKLLFYAHAWYIAQTDIPLFEEDFEAWPWGPVIRDVYLQTRDYGREAVTGMIRQLSLVNGSSPFDFNFSVPRVTDAGLQAYIRGVWDSHKGFTGIQLSNATHAPGEPWTIVKDRYGDLKNKPTIRNDLIAAVFKQKLNVSTNDSAARSAFINSGASSPTSATGC